jgi:uncharacterized membrane protein
MAFCSSCGATIADGAAFCPQCGKGQGAAASSGAPAGAQSGLAENVASGLCYVLGWLTGLIFLLIDKRPSVRFHAAQSIVVFGGLHILRVILGVVFGFGMFGGWWGGHMMTFGLAGLVFGCLGLLTFILWIVLMVKGFQGEKFRVPMAADFAEQLVGK